MRTYEINVAYGGRHDFTMTVSKNGGEVSWNTMRFLERTLQGELGPGYELDITEVCTDVIRRRIGLLQ